MNNWAEHQPLLARDAYSDLPACGLLQAVTVGHVLGHYRLVEQIAVGGIGVVYRAYDERLDRDVALKVLSPDSLNDPAACKRFRNEARILSKLNHANIATVHDFDNHNGIDFLVMEYVPGQTLSARLQSGPLVQEEVLHIGRQIAAAIQEAHERGIIHHDLKPSNILLTPTGQVKIADFGLASRLLPLSDPATTVDVARNIEVLGTLPYMAPEQLRGERADFRSDIYSTGAVLYELATGLRPFRETHGVRLIDSILHQTPLPSTLTGRVSFAVKNIILKCLQKEPAERYQSAAELGVNLQLTTHLVIGT
jgi:serine/threonine protein kinase